jgi:hypothetical protein
MRFNTDAGGAGPRFVANEVEPDGDEVRVETERGREWLVAPVVLVREGVLNGGFLSFEAIQASVSGWNGRPVTLPPAAGTEAATLAPEDGVSGHPVETNGDGEPEFVSANQAPYIEEMHGGHLRNVETRTDLPTDDGQMSARGLVGEAWVDVARAEALGSQAAEAIRAVAQGDPLDVSTGYFHRPTRRSGRHEGEPYEQVQTNVMPDHLALLPNERGACSWADGCGTPRAANSDLPPAMRAAGTATDGGLWATVKHTLGIEDGPGTDGAGAETTTAAGAEAGTCHECHSTMHANQSQGDVVTWSASGGDAYGVVEELRESEDAEPFDSEIDGDGGPINPPAALIEVYRPDDDGEWAPSGTMVAHRTDTDTLTVLDGFPDAATANAVLPAMHNDIEPEALAERTAFEADALREWDEGDLATLAESVEPPDGGDGGGSGTDGGTGTNNNSTDGDGTDADTEALREQVDTLTEEVEALREEQTAALREQVVTHSDLTDEDLEELPEEAVETLHERVVPEDPEPTAAGPQGNRVNYVGQGGAASAPSDDDEADEYADSVGALTAAEGDD